MGSEFKPPGFSEPIALVGSGCRFPGGANSPSKLWSVLGKPRDLQSKVPPSRFKVDSFYHRDGSFHGRTSAPYAYFLDGNIRAFDAGFFGIKNTEADVVDPQHRLLLESVYEALCTAGLRIEDLQGSDTAVYVGQMMNDYKDIINHDLEAIPTYAATGTSASILSNRISYFFDWHGPSMTIDTACSSSLVAVHHAVQQLRTGGSKVAVAAGANLILSPIPFIVESKLNMLSPTGRSRMWDAEADGYARGEGVAAVVLKTLSQALADGDEIECLIRETGVNQDGRSPGITMPNHQAQEALIRSTYAAAGLDPLHPKDRCQYFEAHGTGTPAGDPQEAEAIATVFFDGRQRGRGEDPLYVGSVKTVVGHTEGTAGIAGLLKVSLAMQHRIIPPNLLFETLSPRVEPFCDNLQLVVKNAQPWPEPPPGAPMRASVNSFGFGGTNAHAIVEHCQEPFVGRSQIKQSSAVPVLPLVVSASSEAALKTAMGDLISFLKREPDVEIQDLAWTLWQKRSVLAARRALVAQNVPAACSALETAISSITNKEGLVITSGAKRQPHVVGIFTGQGAQWPAMGKALVSRIPQVGEILDQLDQSLRVLPAAYRPSWTLREQLLLESEDSNVHDAKYSQPLCCAVQILLVHLLRSAGVKFKAVVGHSSGEIACAFAAGFITASQAIRIAHLRGLVTSLAASPNGTDRGGAMLATGCTLADARELCDLEVMEGRLCVAACNAPDSITLSGDADAIREAEAILADEGKFARLLKVNKAYHSFHMKPCVEPYLKSLREGACDALSGNDTAEPETVWISSVKDCKRMARKDVTPQYWIDNLVSPVLFTQALEHAVTSHSPIDLAIEVGCHPALQGPSQTTIEACRSSKIPYTGCMRRGVDSIDAFSTALGYIWERLGSDGVDINGLISAMPKTPVKDLSKTLPAYPWDHSKSYWSDSRITSASLGGSEQQPHLLLGKLSPMSTLTALRWHNFIRPRDISWLDSHQLQGQTVFPGAGYVIMAVEAAIHATGGRVDVQLVEVLDVQIFKAVTFDDENSLVELSLSLDVEPAPSGSDYLTASFRIDCCLARETALSASTSGRVIVTCGPISSHGALPPPLEEPPHLTPISVDTFYKELSAVGYGYKREFRGLTSIRRADFHACGTIVVPPLKDNSEEQQLLLHPAVLDVAFQSLIGAVSAPGDGLMRSLLVPTSIGRIAISPQLCATASRLAELNYHAFGEVGRAGAAAVCGDIEVIVPNANSSGDVVLRVENITTKSASAATAANDHDMFMKWEWDVLEPDMLLNKPERAAKDYDRDVAAVMERMVYFYITKFLRGLTAADRCGLVEHYEYQVSWFEHVIELAKTGQSLFYQPTWERDSSIDIARLVEEWGENCHVRLIQRVGESLQDIFFNDRNAFDLMDHDGLLTELYATGFGPAYYYMQDALRPIAHRFQRMDILEIGAGTGGATRYVLNDNSPAFNSFTYTDISASFFEKAHDRFLAFEDRMEFRTLDARRSPQDQGFSKHAYDVVIAFNVLHATPKLQETMKNVRSLLKPGGHVILVELTNNQHSRVGFIFGLFADWWAGVDEGRSLQPYVGIQAWDEILKKSGFGSVESRFEDDEGHIFPTSVFRAQAVNDKTMRLVQPLSKSIHSKQAPVVIVGGLSKKTKRLVEEVQRHLAGHQVSVIPRLQDIASLGTMETKPTFLVLSEIDDPLFAKLDQARFESIKGICNAARHMLWVLEDAWETDPYQAMTIGLLRTLRVEYANMAMQVLVAGRLLDRLDPRELCEHLLRLEEGFDWHESGILWTVEPELYYAPGEGDKNVAGRMLIPRLKPDKKMNDRLNSHRREILEDRKPSQEPVFMRHSDPGRTVYLQSNESYAPSRHRDASASVTVRVGHSLVRAIRVGRLGYFHLVLGKTAAKSGSATRVLALAQENGSLIEVPRSRVVNLSQQSKYSSPGFLLLVAADLLAQTLLDSATSGAHIVVYAAPTPFASRISLRAAKQRVHVTFVSTQARSVQLRPGISWVKLHDRVTQSQLSAALPMAGDSVSAFYDMSVQANSPVNLASTLASHFARAGCPVFPLDYVARLSAAAWTELGDGMVWDMLNEAVGEASATSSHQPSINGGAETSVIPATPAQEFVSLQRPIELSAVADWHTNDVVSARVAPIDSGRLFSPDRAYLLIGLTGDLGRSICRWMLGHGARYVVLSSRRPSVEQRWIDEMEKLGGCVMVLPMDVSDEKSVDEGLARINSEMPALGGVAFGPLVLQDSMLENMELWQMQAVLAAKVRGSKLLNERIDESQNPLEFFIMCSSFIMVCGNPGQSAYGAANAYTHAITQQRRSRGLAGSTMDMGAIWGVGYIVRAGRDEEYESISYKFGKVSETELHALFAESIVAGRPGHTERGGDAEVLTGMRYLDPEIKALIPHFNDPRLGHFILAEKRGRTGASGSALMSVKESLQKATTMDEIRQIITDGLAEKLRSTLQIPQEDSVNLDVPLIDQGVDSLSAVTIGTWFSKNLHLDLPLLKILGGASINDLAEEATGRLLPTAIPLVAEVQGGVESGSGQANGAKPEPAHAANGVNGSNTLVTNGRLESTHRKVPMSLTQENWWNLQKRIPDNTAFNSTIGMYMKGNMDVPRLESAFNTLLQRHSIFRTRFLDDPDSCGAPTQIIMDEPKVRFEAVPVADRAAAERGFANVNSSQYDIGSGDTLRLVDFYWAADEHIVIVAYNPLVMDGWTYERLFIELSHIYGAGDASSLPPAPQYHDFAIRQRTLYERGGMDDDLAYWASMHEPPAPTLPVLALPQATRADPCAKRLPVTIWKQHTSKMRVTAAVAAKIKEASRRTKVTPMQFYLTAFQWLLARLGGQAAEDVVVGVADPNRPDLDDLSTFGPYVNMLPVRFSSSSGSDDTFFAALSKTKDLMRAALKHSRVPTHLITKRLGLRDGEPLFRAVFDYKSGQAESGMLGEATMEGVLADRAGTPHEITLEMSDDPAKKPLVTVKLNTSVYGAGDVDVVMREYMEILATAALDQGCRIR